MSLNKRRKMDVTGFDVGALGAAIGSIITAVKGFNSAKKAEAKASSIEEARLATKIERDKEFQRVQTEVAVVKKEVENLNKRLDEGNHRFERLENKLDDVVHHQNETNKLLIELISKVGSGNGK